MVVLRSYNCTPFLHSLRTKGKQDEKQTAYPAWCLHTPRGVYTALLDKQTVDGQVPDGRST